MICLIDHLAGNDRLRDKSCFALPFLGDKYTGQFFRAVMKNVDKGSQGPVRERLKSILGS